MSYFNRPFQLWRTLDSITKTKHTDVEIVIVDDASEPALCKPEGYPFPVHIIRIPKEKKDWKSPTVCQNLALQKALDLGGEIIFSQNPECTHIGDVIMYAEEMLKDNGYISFSCFSLDEENTRNKDLDLAQVIRENNVGATYDGGNFFYNHPVHRAVAYDFCACTTRKNWLSLNGMDERFKDGIAYSDDNLVCRWKRLGLALDIPHPEREWKDKIRNPFVVHLNHYNPNSSQYDNTPLVEKNRDLYNELGADGSGNYRATHILTPDLQ